MSVNYRIPQTDIEFNPPVYMCKKATKPFTLDGNIDKPFWEDIPFTDYFVDIEGDKRPMPRFKTRAKMTWDDENFYFGAVLEGPEIWATLTERDCVIFQDNDFEIFIDSNSDTHAYFEFEMNALNTVWDLMLTKPYRDGGKPINAFDIQGMQTAVHIDGELNNPKADNKRWMVEVVMPFAVLRQGQDDYNRNPKAGEYYRVNFSRVHWRVDETETGFTKQINPETGRSYPEDNWVWAPTGLINIHYVVNIN
ncbi:MAG: carbohydrate-binding family 9-like protein [Zhenhengia sp.]